MTANQPANQQRIAYSLALVLAMLTAVLFWPATRHEFIIYDDHDYVTGNPAVQRGLNWETVKWAFTSGHAANWHPVTWLSHALDCQMHGLNPTGHHQTSVLLHAVNVGLLLLLLVRLTGHWGMSVFVAAVFAWHPQRVESVAWVAERKDLLSGFFFLLTLLAYGRYASAKCGVQSAEQHLDTSPCPLPDRGGEGRRASAHRAVRPSPSSIFHPHSSRWYWLAFGFFALGLMSKPMLVTLPFVLMLLDYWPLNRLANDSWQVAGSKIGSTPHPTLSPSEAERAKQPSSIIHQPSTFRKLVMEKLPFLALALASCVATYAAQKAGGAVREFGLESRLANIPLAYLRYLEKFFHPDQLAVIYPFKPVSAATGVLAGLVVVALCVLAFRLARRYPFGFTGWFWFVGMLVPVIGFIQVGYQAFADRYMYLPGIGLTIVVAGSALEICRRCKLSKIIPTIAGAAVLAILPGLTRAYLAHWRNTIELFEYSVRSTGPHTIALKNMGLAYMEAGQLEKSQACFEQSLAIEPDDQPTLFNLGSILLQQSRTEAALPHLRKLAAAKVLPHEAAAYARVAVMLADRAQYADAISFYEQALAGDANQLDALNNLAWLRATAPDAQWRNGAESVRLAERACDISGQRIAVLLGTLAAAYAEAGRFPEAIATAEKARSLAQASQQPDVAQSNERLLELYRAGKPFRDAR